MFAFPWKTRLYIFWQHFVSSVGIISSRICLFILPDSQQSGSWWGALLEMPQLGPGMGQPLHSPEWSVTHFLPTANKNCL